MQMRVVEDALQEDKIAGAGGRGRGGARDFSAVVEEADSNILILAAEEADL